jgi:tetratricopeptide (TPR) repeat protein
LKLWSAAAWYLTRQIEQKPGDASLHLRRGKVYANLPQRQQEALRDLTTATQLAPEDWEVWRSRARVYTSIQDWEHALDDYEIALRLKPDDWQLYQSQAVVYERLERWDKAAECYTKALDLVPTSQPGINVANLWRGRARINERLGRWPEVVADYTMIIEREGRTAWAYAARATANAELGQWRLAEQDFAEVVRLAPSNYRTWYQLAVAQLAQEDKKRYSETCQEMFRRFGQTSTTSQVANEVAWTGALAANSGVPGSELVRLANQAVRISPQQTYLNTLGAAHYRAGEYDKAVQRLEESRQAFIRERELSRQSARPSRPQKPGDDGTVWDWLFLAMAHHQLGKTEEARKWLDKATPVVEQYASDNRKEAGSSLTWNQRVELRLLHREATKLLGPKSP